MYLLVHKGNGHYIGSSVTVIAKDMEEANRLTRQALDEMGLKDEKIMWVTKIDLNKAIDRNEGKIIDQISGDY